MTFLFPFSDKYPEGPSHHSQSQMKKRKKEKLKLNK